MMQPNKKTQQGFTLIELLVVIAIIGILSTLSIIALSNARAKSRDAKRVADIKQISTALDLYYADYGYYPTIITPGNPLVSSDNTKTYIDKIPNNPSPRNDSGCGDNNYTYASTSNNSDYSLNFCLSSSVGSLSSGINSASNSGLGSAPGLVGWWKLDETSGTTAYDSSGQENNGTLKNTPAFTNSNCKFGNCLTLNGSNYIELPKVVDSGAITLVFWTNTSYLSAQYTLFQLGSATNNFFWVQPGSNRCFVDLNNSWAYYSNTNSYFDGKWHMLSVTIPGPNPADIANTFFVIDGVKATVWGYNAAANPRSSYDKIIIGSVWGGDSIQGAVDDIRVYNRALSTQELLALYNATK